jgi:hypothetical protein
MATHQEEMAMVSDLQEPLSQLETYVLGYHTEGIEFPSLIDTVFSELQTTLSKCQRRYKRRDGFAKYRGMFMDWKDREATQRELARLEQNVNTFYLHFLVSPSV